MKKQAKARWKWILTPALAAVLVLSLAGLAFAAGPRSGQQAQNSNQSCTITTAAPASGTLEASQAGLILYLLEEEKLAGDVYAYLYDEFDARVFTRIAASEDRHVEAVMTLVSSYALDIPSSFETAGQFDNEELQELYNKLIEDGSKSLTAAYEAGALIEQTDIDDLKELLAEDPLPADVEQVLNNLLKGSLNHQAAFDRQLSR